MWLDSLVPEEELATERQQLKFTTELPEPPPLIGEWIIWCYAIAATLMLIVIVARIARPAIHIRRTLGGRRRANQFIRAMLPTSALVFVWSSALLGSVMSGAVVLARWALLW